MKKIIIILPLLLILINHFYSENKKNNISIIDIQGKILVLTKVKDIEDKEAISIFEQLLKKFIDNDRCEIIKIEKIDNDKKINKNEIIRLGNENNADYIYIGIIKKNILKKIFVSATLYDAKNGKIKFAKEINKELSEEELEYYDYIETENKDIKEIIFFQRGNEISIGSGFYPLRFEVKYTGLKHITDNSIFYSSDGGFIMFKWGIMIPFSFSYNFNPYSSIGFLLEAGYAPGFFIATCMDEATVKNNYINSIFFNLFFKHKFGDINKNFRFLLEYGVFMEIDIPAERIIDDDPVVAGDLFIDLGPELLLGFEYHKNNFSLEFGFFIGTTFGWQSFENYTIDTTNGWNINFINEGFKLRFSYNYHNYYNKKIKLDFERKRIEKKKIIVEEEIKEEIKVEEKPEVKKEKSKAELIKEAKKGDVIIFSDIIFYANSDMIKEESYPVVDEIAAVLNERKDIIIEIGGYTNATGNPEAELLLSIKRATAVARHLISEGIKSNRIKTAGYGALSLKEEKIIESNRRVEIKILNTIK